MDVTNIPNKVKIALYDKIYSLLDEKQKIEIKNNYDELKDLYFELKKYNELENVIEELKLSDGNLTIRQVECYFKTQTALNNINYEEIIEKMHILTNIKKINNFNIFDINH